MEIKFNGKTEYLAWRSEWKRQYKEMSQDIRSLKICCREQQRVACKLPRDKYGFTVWPKETKAADLIPQEHRETYSETEAKYKNNWGFYPGSVAKLKLRPKATEMLEALKQAKLEAQRQYLADPQRSVRVTAGAARIKPYIPTS